MTKNKFLFLSLWIVLLTCMCFYLIHKNTILETQVKTLSKNLHHIALHKKPTSYELSKQQFREDYFIRQLDRDTTLLLSLIGTLLVIFGYLSFKNFDNIVTTSVKESNDKIEKFISEENIKHNNHREGYIMLNQDIRKLGAEVSIQIAHLDKERARVSFNSGNYNDYVFYQIFSTKYYADFYNSFDDKNLVQTILKVEKKALKDLLINIKQNKPTGSFNTGVTLNLFEDIEKFNDPEIEILLSKILSSLELSDDADIFNFGPPA